MKREALIRELRKAARKQGFEFEVITKQGKGSHYIVRLDGKMSTIPSGEISPKFAKLIKKQLGL